MTKKTLKDILGEGYLDDMQTPDTVAFVAKHKVDNEPVKKDKKVGTDNDEVFKASNVKKVGRTPHHGHEPEKSKDVYEAMDSSVTSPTSMNIAAPSYAVPTPKKKPEDLKTNIEKPATGSTSSSTVTKTGPQSSTAVKAVEEVETVDEKTLTPAEMKKRKEIADAIKRDHPEYSDEKKMRIATAKAIEVAESPIDSYVNAITKTNPKRPFNEASTDFGKQFAAAADAYRKGEGSDVAKIGGKDIAIKYADPASQKKLESDRAAAIKAKSDTAAKVEPPKAEPPKVDTPKASAPQTSIEKKGSDAVASAQSNQFTSRPIGGSGIGIGAQTKGQTDSAIRNVVGGDKAPATTFGPRANKTPPAASTSQPKDTSQVPSSDDKGSEGKFSTNIFKLQNLRGKYLNTPSKLKGYMKPDVQKMALKVSSKGGVVYGNKTIPSSRANESVDEAVWDNPSPNKTPEKLTSAEKAKAKARAKAAGRPYPNLVDNMAVAANEAAIPEIKPADFHSWREGKMSLDDIATKYKTDKPRARAELNLHKDHWQQGEAHYNKLFKEEIHPMDNEINEALKTPSQRVNHYHNEINKLLKGIAQGIHQMKRDAGNHQGYGGKGPHWGHVGTLSDFHKQLSDLHDRVHQQGEYMRPSVVKEEKDEDDEGYYTHRQMHGPKGISKEDWKKGWRMNSKGERVKMKTEEVEQIDELDLETYKSYNKASKASGEETLDKLSKGGFKKQLFKKYLNRKHGQERAVRLAGKKVLGEEEAINEAAIKFHYEGPKGAAHIKKDSDTGEHVVRFWKKTDDGLKRHEPADYFTDDKEDAHGTAKKMVGEHVERINERMKLDIAAAVAARQTAKKAAKEKDPEKAAELARKSAEYKKQVRTEEIISLVKQKMKNKAISDEAMAKKKQ